MSVEITYFVHGTTTDNEHHLATGWLPGELSEAGRQQAKDLGGMVADRHFDVVFCSDLTRAIDSAELGFGATYQIIQDERLRECNYGNMNGKSATSFKDRMEDFIDTPFPQGESYKDVEARLASFVDFLRVNYDDKHVAIVAHQAPQLALDVILGGKTWQQAIKEDWRKTKAWQPGWEYIVETNSLLSDFDKTCLDLAIAEARHSLVEGNYPVGAILAIGDTMASRGNNTGETSKNYSNHAETSLIINNGEALLQSADQGETVTLYSTLEPCLMCLGVATMNKVSKIVYIQTDPHAGACGIDKTSLGVRYQEVWPQIIHAPYSLEPKEMIVAFLKKQIEDNKRVAWSQKFLTLLENTR